MPTTVLSDKIMKKFYRDFTDTEVELVEELQDIMADCRVFIPPFVVKKMLERRVISIPNDVRMFDDNGDFIKENTFVLYDSKEYRFVESVIHTGFAYEFSNEGVHNPIAPYRIVWVDDYEGYTYFVKTSVPPMRGSVRVVDVWRKKGTIPTHPLREQRAIFARGARWDISLILKMLVDVAKTQVDHYGIK